MTNTKYGQKRRKCFEKERMLNEKICYLYDLLEKQDELKDNINPNHYKQGKVECIEAIESATTNKTGIEAFYVGNIIKYLWRYESKNVSEDIKKAKWYLDRLIEVKHK